MYDPDWPGAADYMEPVNQLPDQHFLYLYHQLHRKRYLLYAAQGADSLWTAPCTGSLVVRFTEAGGTYLINGTEYVGILPAVNEILFNLGPDSPYWAELMPKLTSYLGGSQMLTTLFRIPAIGLAMYHTSYLKNRKMCKGVIMTCVLTAFLGNITEPLEFSFLFISPQLFAVYCVLCGLMTIPYQFLHTASDTSAEQSSILESSV